MDNAKHKRKLVTLEPDLEAKAAFLGAYDCLALARTYERWARQLRVKARILMRVVKSGPRKAKWKPLPLAQQKKN